MTLSQILFTLFLNILLTIILLQFKNKSNFNSIIIIPIISSLFVKYLLGDWDKGYEWSISDISYWLYLISTSSIYVYLFDK